MARKGTEGRRSPGKPAQKWDPACACLPPSLPPRRMGTAQCPMALAPLRHSCTRKSKRQSIPHAVDRQKKFTVVT
ncbi:hypothetical protein SAY87_027200 [Trapa incisa]|uniref:Uncharacterized protein n=1 Tax=Trapa incisa TaxID=236973 RepID=A0AAN7JEP8_9MYRT|nr:hypothetical protein SAY87_027200 [Trapa incisa]